MAEKMFDGFDHTQYREEVEQRWGAQAYTESDRWWRSKTAQERADFQSDVAELSHAWSDAAQRGIPADGDEAQALAARHVAWLTRVPGTPASVPGGDLAAYVNGLADMYVADDRFAKNYGGRTGAEFVRDALRVYVGG